MQFTSCVVARVDVFTIEQCSGSVVSVNGFKILLSQKLIAIPVPTSSLWPSFFLVVKRYIWTKIERVKSSK